MNKTCFGIAPLGHEGTEVRRRSDELTELVIEPALESFSYSIIRIDKLSRPGNITRDIIQHILEADLVIADISGSNPNVMYELGVRHSTGKPVVLMTSESDRIPFDISDIRVLVYELKSATLYFSSAHLSALFRTQAHLTLPCLKPKRIGDL
ncbi:MAG: hypothetical protein E8D40_03465 [Nitrospira sp.]|nr:MAG: hypothetical protein E8D40_03465 [Nitrospira sp.]